MAENHPSIKIGYVPANCTSKLQPCNAVIQRPLKLSIKRTSHEDLIKEIMDGFATEDVPAHEVRLTQAIPVL